MAAAPADFRPASVVDEQDRRRRATPRSIALAETRRHPREHARSRARPGAVVVGFALETDDVVANARRKLDAKALDLIVVNDATEPGAGFGVDTNRVTIFDARHRTPERLPLLTKHEVADAILDRVEALLRGR